MTQTKTATRRMFLKGGALLAAPVAVGSAAAVALAGDHLGHHAARLEDEAALRTLHHDWLRQVNAGAHDPRLDPSLRRIIPDLAGAADRIEVATDRQTATGHFDYRVEFETVLPPDSTLAQMAHAQGHGATRRSERRLLTVRYGRADEGWMIREVTMCPA